MVNGVENKKSREKGVMHQAAPVERSICTCRNLAAWCVGTHSRMGNLGILPGHLENAFVQVISQCCEE